LKKKFGLVRNMKLIFNMVNSIVRNRSKFEKLVKLISMEKKSKE
jgi:hypothetical protein